MSHFVDVWCDWVRQPLISIVTTFIVLILVNYQLPAQDHNELYFEFWQEVHIEPNFFL